MKAIVLSLACILSGVVLVIVAPNPSVAAEAYTVAERVVDFISNMYDDRVTIGSCQNVFIGKVLRNLGVTTTPTSGEFGGGGRPSGPDTLFEVEVLRNIKAELPQKVIVRMAGGIFNGVYVRYRSPDPLNPDAVGLLTVGASYAFQTTGLDTNALFLQPHPNLRTLITNDSTASTNQILGLAKLRISQLIEGYVKETVRPESMFKSSDELRNRLEPADAIRYDRYLAEMKAHRAKYNFAALPAEAQQHFRDEAARLKAELAAEAASVPPTVLPKAEPLPAP